MARRKRSARRWRAQLAVVRHYVLWASAGAAATTAFVYAAEVRRSVAERVDISLNAVVNKQPAAKVYTPPATCTEPYVAHGGNSQGFGHQYYLFVTGYMVARISNKTFCVTNWHRVAHEQDAAKMFRFASGDAFGPRAPSGFEPMNIYRDLYRHVCKLSACTDNPESRQPWEQEQEFWFDVADKHKEQWDYLIAGLYEQHAEDIRQKYLVSPKPALEWFDGREALALAVHVRRGDIEHGRRISDARILECVQVALASLQSPSHDTAFLRPQIWEIHIFSDSTVDQLRGIVGALPGARLHLQAQLEASFHHMAMADALIVARSSFSAMAAYLSHGFIFAPFDPRNVSFYGHQMLIRRGKLRLC